LDLRSPIDGASLLAYIDSIFCGANFLFGTFTR